MIRKQIRTAAGIPALAAPALASGAQATARGGLIFGGVAGITTLPHIGASLANAALTKANDLARMSWRCLGDVMAQSG